MINLFLIALLNIFQTPEQTIETYNFELFGSNQKYIVLNCKDNAKYNYQLLMEVKIESNVLSEINQELQKVESLDLETESLDMVELLRQFKPFSSTIKIKGKNINSVVSINRVVFMRKLPAEPKPDAKLQYISFGNEKEQFVMHIQQFETDFGQIIKLKKADETISNYLEEREFTLLTVDSKSIEKPLPIKTKVEVKLGEEMLELDLHEEIKI